MAKGKIKGSKDHSFEFKEKIINEYSISNKSYSEIAKQYHISLATISKWVNQFQQNKEILKERKNRKDFELNKFKNFLERENYLLKKENERIKSENEVLKKLEALPKKKTKTNIKKQIAFIKSELQVSKITLSWYLKELIISYYTWNKYSKTCDEYQLNIDYSIDLVHNL